MTASFNPYHQWLGIPPQQQPVDHYRLVGVDRFESNPQAIVASCQQQTMKVAPYVSGEHAEAAQQLLAELSTAQSVLLNPNTRTTYDEQLRAQAAGVAAGVSSGGSTPPSSPIDDGQLKRPKPRWRDDEQESTKSTAATLGTATAAAAAPASATAGESSDAPADGDVEPSNDEVTIGGFVPWILGGGLAGLMAAVFVGLLMLIGRGTSGESTDGLASDDSLIAAVDEDDDDERRSGRPIPPDARLTFRDDDPNGDRMAPSTDTPTDLGTLPDDLGKGDEADTSLTTPDPGDDGSADTATSDPPPTPVRANPVANLANFIELPKAVGDGGSVNETMISLGPIDVKDDDEVALKLVRDAALPGDVARFALRSDPDDPRRWEVWQANPAGQKVSVAEYFVSSGDLQFRWLPDAAVTGADYLRNSLIEVAVAEQSATVPLRETKTMPPLVMKFDGGAVAASVDLDAIPTSKKLQLALAPMTEDFPAHQFDPSAELTEGDQTDIWFGDAGDSLRLVLRVSLSKVGTRRFRVEARPMLNVPAQGKKLDYFKPATAARELGQLKQQQIALQTQIDDTPRIYRRDRTRRDQILAALGQQMQQLQTRIDTLESIATLCQSLHGQASLDLRLYMTVDEHEVDLARSEAPAAEGEEPDAS